MASNVSNSKSKRPSNTAFKQQRLRAWQPLLSPKTVLPTFFIIGLIFAPIGGVLFWLSSQLFEYTIDYTNCAAAGSSFTAISSDLYSQHYSEKITNLSAPQQKYDSDSNVCTLQFTIPINIASPIFFYYRLTKFYQNHRKYVNSFDAAQLRGKARTAQELAGGSCEPLATRTINGVTKPIYPCGLIANSVFNDTISNMTLLNPTGGSNTPVQFNFSSTGIPWDSDSSRFLKSVYKNDEAYPPLNWDKRYPLGYTDENPIPDLSEDYNLQVWMRTAPLSTFRKLYAINEKETLISGIYQVNITMDYDVTKFAGTKAIVLATTNSIGGRNPVLGIVYITVGILCVILGIVFTIRHLYRPRRLGDHTYLSWNQQVQSGLSENTRNPNVNY
ncbi:hypothetical protein BB561_000230 [Smittium simulii]|uniref:Cell cycle control protein n=1 Tax=Smittium simulii TaxID=133385 RepID=A0A2T9YZP7_9FUNG|nr:hypothetical protein BB561_000230 [Smittium simulii]